MKSDIEIAQEIQPKLISKIAQEIGISDNELIPYGKYKAKVNINILEKLKDKQDGFYINVTAITPTPLGEGKTTTAIGLTQGLGKLGKKVIACLRQPSMGPTFGIKGGAAGGGYSQIIPMEDFNLHLTGDMHAITSAHNLIAAAIDARMMHERNYDDSQLKKKNLKRLNINPYEIQWRRVIDVNDRALRNIIIGLGTQQDGYPRESGFDITPASELMAILALAKDLKDLKQRISQIIVAFNKNKEPIRVEDLGLTGAVTVIMKDAIMPNLIQTLEGQPVFIHAGPFANIAHGNSSVIADLIALKLADYVVTESGFGADIGMEKFFNIKCRVSNKFPNVVVIVATVRALKVHGKGTHKNFDYTQENLELVEKGCINLGRNIEIAKLFNVPVVVAINKFPTDTQKELEVVKKKALEYGAFNSVICEHYTKGGEGAIELAQAVIEAVKQKSNPNFLYDTKLPIKEKIEIIAKKVYKAKGVNYSDKANKQIKRWEKIGLGNLPICMAKTQFSISHDPKLKGAPENFILPIKEVKASAGAGFLYPLCGDIQLMPGLPSLPAYLNIDIDENGKIKGLF